MAGCGSLFFGAFGVEVDPAPESWAPAKTIAEEVTANTQTRFNFQDRMSLIIASNASANLIEMSRPTSEPFDIFSPKAQERSHAIATVFGGSQQRAARYTSRPADRKEELLFAINDALGNISTAALLTRSPGRTAMIFVTPPHNKADQDRGAALIRKAMTAANELDAVLVQALVFMLLTSVFTLLICEHHDDHGAHDDNKGHARDNVRVCCLSCNQRHKV